MYRHYGRGEAAWPAAARRAKAFIGGPLYRHVTTWPRHGRLGVPVDLDGPTLCSALRRLLQDQGEFGLLADPDGDRLLVLPLHGAREPIVLCYGAWPGIETWDHRVEPGLPRGTTLLHSRWNVMPPGVGSQLAPRGAPGLRCKATRLEGAKPINWA